MVKEPSNGGTGRCETAVETPRPGIAERAAAAGGALVKAAPWVADWCRRQWSGLAVAAILLVPWILGARAATRRAEQATARSEARFHLLEAELKAERQGAGKLRGDLGRSTGELSSVRAQLGAQPRAATALERPTPP